MDTDDDDARRFGDLFPAVYQRFHRRLRPGDERLSSESRAVLAHLGASGPLTVAEACGHFERSQSAMSELFARLERRELVARMPDERDRRRVLVWLTPRGRDLLAREQDVLSRRLLIHAFRQMASEDRARLVEGLQALLATERAESGFDEPEES